MTLGLGQEKRDHDLHNARDLLGAPVVHHRPGYQSPLVK